MLKCKNGTNKTFHVNSRRCPNINRHLGPPPNYHFSPSFPTNNFTDGQRIK